MQPTADEIRAGLDRVLASEGFASTARLRRFLRYVVERSLAGEGHQLKEYAIGVAVFNRDERYDPRIDSIVRVEAGRLRTKLDQHYSGAGAADSVLISMPRGTYAPVFERRQGAPATPGTAVDARGAPLRPASRRHALAVLAVVIVTLIAVWGTVGGTRGERPASTVRIVVLPFASYSADTADRLLSARLTDGVTSELARIGTLAVVSRTSALHVADARRPLRELAQTLNADIVVEASMETEGDRVRVQTRLVDAVVDRKSWIYDFDGRRADLADLERRIAEGITAAARGHQ